MSEEQLDPNAIAIVGMAGRFPGASSPRGLWKNLLAGVESIDRLSEENLAAAGVPEELRNSPNYVGACAFLEGPDEFDAPFFGIPPREAELLDPQQRVFLEVAWEAFEDAGYDPARIDGPVGVFAGSGKNHYAARVLSQNPAFLRTMGAVAETIAGEKDFLATRVSYKFDLHGPSVSVQTACSTSLVAVHLGCMSLLSHECDLVLAGGSSISSFQREGYAFQDGGIFSPDGHLRAFDAKAAGQVGGSGSAAVVLKRLADAIEDGDDVRAVILGSALNNDGRAKVSFSAPGVDGQAGVVAEALEVAGVEADSIGFVECHGTGTRLGDPIEVTALTQAFRASTDGKAFCALGSVKTNVGHLDAASGVTGLIKAALSVRDGSIPASLHFETPNPELNLGESPFFVAAKKTPFPTAPDGGPRRAGVSSFGMGGTNAHAILEEPPQPRPRPESDARQLLVVSARSAEALERAADNLATRLEEEGEALSLADVAFTTQLGRRAFAHRRAVVAESMDGAVAALRAGAISGALDRATLEGGRRVAFLFSGQGSQYAGMTRGLYERFEVFREELDRVLALFRDALGVDLAPWILCTGEDEEAKKTADLELAKTQATQPALFAVEWALAKLAESFGLEPVAMLGHSVGEYVAACLAGVFDLESAVRLVAARGRLIGSLPSGEEEGSGAMMAIPLSVEAVERALADGGHGRISIAVVNAPELVVVGGPGADLEVLRKELRSQRVAARKLHTSHAFHTSLMDPILDAFEAQVRAAQPKSPTRRIVSCTTGEWLTEAEARDPMYWVRHLRSPVRFEKGVCTLAEAGKPLLLELGPGDTLASLSPLSVSDLDAVASTRHPRRAGDDVVRWLEAIGALFCSGVRVDFSGCHQGESPRRVSLPTYPFEHQRYWVESSKEAGEHREEVRLADPADWTFGATWKRSRSPLGGTLPDSVLVVGIGAVADAVASTLADAGVRAERSESWSGRETCSAVVDLRGLAAAHVERGDLAASAAAEERFFFQPFAALREVAARVEGGGAEAPAVLFVTSGMQSVFDEVVEPERALLLGVVKAANAEIPGSLACSVDVGAGLAAEEIAGIVAAELAGLLGVGGSEHLDGAVAWRRVGAGACRWLPEIEALGLREAAEHSAADGGGEEHGGGAGADSNASATGRTFPSPHPPRGWDSPRPRRLRAKPVFLITGGLGGIGLSLAEGLASSHQARLVLLSRRAFPERETWEQLLAGSEPAANTNDERNRRAIEAIVRMEALGAEVITVAADVTDEAAVHVAVTRAEGRFGPIEGVLHAAGVAGGGLLALRSDDDARAVLGPKVRGTRVLEAVLAGRELAVFALCSSLATSLEGVGQIDYFAANAFLDAYARSCAAGSSASTGSAVVSIGWEAWREVGMAAETNVSGALAAGREESLRFGLGSDEGRDVFRRILASGLSHVLVSTRELRRRMEEAVREARLVLGRSERDAGRGAVATPRPAASAHPRPELETAYVSPSGATEERVAHLWADLLGIDRVGSADDFFDLGGNSLLLMQLSVRLREVFDVGLTMRELFDTPTAASLAERIDMLSLLADVGGDESAGDVETEEFRL